MKKTAILFMLLFAVLSLNSQTKFTDIPELAKVREKILEKIDSNLTSSISIGVSLHGQTVWKESFGWADKENNIKATPNTIYALGSLSKSITGTGIFALLDEDKLSIDDSVAVRIYGQNVQNPTVAQLLAMEGGVPHFFRYVDLENSEYRPEDDFDEFGMVVFSPGKFHQYSNMSYGLLYNLIEEASNMSAPEFLKKNLFDKLEMVHTYCGLNYLEQNANLAIGYSGQGNRLNRSQFEPLGGGGFYSSVSDLLKYGNFHLSNKDSKGNALFEEKTFDNIHRPSIGQKHKWYLNGWGTLTYAPQKEALISNGAIAGAASTLLLEKNNGLVVVCLTNNSVGNSFTDEIAYEIANAFIPDFNNGIKELFQRVESDFAPKEYNNTQHEMGTWHGNMMVQGDKIPLTIKINDDVISVIQNGKEEIQLTNVSRQYNGLVRGTLESVFQIGKKSIEGHTATLTFDIGKETILGGLMLISNESQPDGLPYFLELNKQ